MKSKLALGIAITIMAFVLFIGCSGNDDSSPTDPGDPDPDPDPVSCITEVEDDIDTNTVWGDDCDTIRVLKSIDVHADLKILPGTVVQMEEDVDINVDDGGSLNAVGVGHVDLVGDSVVVDTPIVFEGTDSVPGWWSGIAIETRDQKNAFDYVIIRHAGGVGFKNNRWVFTIAGGSTSPGAVRMIGTKIEYCDGVGLVIRSGGELRGEELLDAKYLWFHAISGEQIWVAFSAIGDLDRSFKFTSTGFDSYVRVTKGTLDRKSGFAVLDWNMFYVVERECDIAEEGHLVIGRGTTVRFEQGVQLESNEGILEITGTEDDPVRLTGVEEIPGYWGGVGFESLRTDNKVENAIIEYAGSGFRAAWECGIFVSGNATTKGMVSLQNVHIRNVDGDGIYVRNGGSYEMNNVTFENISGDNIVDENSGD